MANKTKPVSKYVGYGNPPVDTRFKKGQSGNPGGRPKGSQNLISGFRKFHDQKVRVKVTGRTRLMSKRDAMWTQLSNQSASGKMSAIQTSVQVMKMLDAHVMASDGTPQKVDPKNLEKLSTAELNTLLKIMKKLNIEEP